MSYPINQKINPYQQPAMGVNTAVQPLQNIDTETIKQNVDKNPVMQAANQENPLLLWGLTLPIWFGISRVMERFNKACATKTDGTPNLLDKVRNFGDKIGQNFESDKFKKISNFIKNKRIFLDEKVVKRSPVLNSLFHTPTKPKFSMAVMMSKGTIAETANDATQAFNAFVKNADGAYNLENLKRLGLSAEKLEEMSKNDYKYVDDIIKACNRMKPDEFVELGKANIQSIPGALPMKKFFRDKLLGENLYTKLFGREIRFSELSNKLEALKGLNGAPGKTSIGKMLPKGFLRTVEGLTNGTAGGKLAIAMQAYCFADALVASIKAPKGDKGKTFAESTVNNLSYYLLMPLGLGILYHVGGLKYIGMNPEQVKNYRAALEGFNARKFTNKAEYVQAKNALKDMLKGSTKLSKAEGAGKTISKCITNIVRKPLKAAGSALSVGLESIKPYVGKETSGAAKSLKDLGFKLKGGAGFPVRFLAYMLVFAPPLANLAVKGCHLIFGRPAKSVIDKEPEKEEQKPALIYPTTSQQQNQAQPLPVMQPTQQNANLTQNQAQPLHVIQPMQQNANLAQTQVISSQRENLVDMYQTNPSSQRGMMTSQELVRTYIPSSEPVKINPVVNQEKDDKANAVLNKADKAEKLANKYIH